MSSFAYICNINKKNNNMAHKTSIELPIIFKNDENGNQLIDREKTLESAYVILEKLKLMKDNGTDFSQFLTIKPN
jgi:hypothetical protein